MFAFLSKLLVAALLRLHVPHRAVYTALSLGYFGSCFGLDKTVLAALAALGYLLLALGDDDAPHE